MNGQSFWNRLNFRQGAAARRVKARDTDIILSNEIVAVSRAEDAAIWPLLRASPEGLEPAEAATRLLRSDPISSLGKDARASCGNCGDAPRIP